ncbi:MAG TPA: glycosyltransferase family 2 protein [Myxococcales bacterium]|nr:glycosyltransferase family 2 protein [Myxococcales bacterium]
MQLSVVIPVYNEERLILGVLRRVAAVPIEKELVVVNDCSRDGTRAVLQRIEADPALVTSADPSGRTQVRVFHQPVNRGKGAALHRGFAEARGEVVVVQDADLEYDPHELPRLVSRVLRGEADVVYGSRFSRGREGFPFWHTLANRMLTALSNVVTGLPLSDMETCYKVMRTSIVRDLPLREQRFGFEPEVTALLAHLSRRRPLRIVEEPISYRPRSLVDGKKIRLKDAFRAVYCIVRYGLVSPSWSRELPAAGEVRPAE